MISYRCVPISSQKGVLFFRHPVVFYNAVGSAYHTSDDLASVKTQLFT